MAGPTIEPAPAFECEVLDADLPVISVKRFEGVLVYVRLVAGSLPSPMTNVLVDAQGDLVGRPGRGDFAPARAELRVPAGRTYPVVLLASLPPIGRIRPYLRRALWPPENLDPEACPVALAGLPTLFRATAGRLVSSPPDPGGKAPSVPTAQELWETESRLDDENRWRAMSLFGISWARPASRSVEELYAERGEAFLATLLEALSDEIEEVRRSAAHGLSRLANKLPVAPFLAMIRDTRPLNYAACEVAAYVFAMHPDEVPVEALVELYRSVEKPLHLSWAFHRAGVEMAALRAMGRQGARAPVQVIADVLAGKGGSYDIRVREAAAAALGDLGALAPVDALIAGMEDLQPEVAAVAAKALAQHPAALPDELRERARLMSDVRMARRVIYGQFLEERGLPYVDPE